MRLVFVTQAIDRDDSNLAVAVDWVRALAARCDEVRVVADHVGNHDLPAHVSFETFGAGSRLARGVRYERALASALRRPRPDAIFVHMVPVFVVLAAPLARARRVPIVLWYAHWRGDWTLRLADRLSAAALSVDRASYPLTSTKIQAIGHGIDLSRFSPRAADADVRPPLRLLALGRTTRWKGFLTLLDGFERAVEKGLDGRLEIRGPSVNVEERYHRAQIVARVAGSPILRQRATVEHPVGREHVPELIGQADAFVTAADSGGVTQTLDKVVYEASACGVPVIASNPALSSHLGGLPIRLDFTPGDADDLARALLEFESATPEARRETAVELRRRAEAGHSVDTWADRVVDAVERLSR